MDFPSERALAQIAFRQARRRHFNARLARLDPEAEVPRFRCECGLIGCDMALRLTAGQYAQVRADTRQFAVHTEHVLPETDRVVETHPGWVTIAMTRSIRRHMDHDGARQQILDGAAARVEKHR